MTRATALAWLALAAGAAAAVWASLAPIGGALPPGVSHQAPRTPERGRPYAADSLRATVVSRDLFRTARRPAPVAYDPVRLAAGPEPPSPPRPRLVLLGLVAGARPTAVVEGFPGVEGPRVVGVGDVVGGLTVAAIGDGLVRIVGMDTVWVLQVREPWRDGR